MSQKILIIALWAVIMPIAAYILPTTTHAAENRGYQSLHPEQLEEFLDEAITTAMEDRHLPGVTVSVVQNGKLVLAKGYGLARTNPPQAVVVDQTLFRIGSISKVITFSGVMQLVDQGALDLDADIMTVLGTVFDDNRFESLTMVDLMTHSAGFEDAYFGFYHVSDLRNDLSTTEYLDRSAPHRVRPPGEQIVYSNYGVNLAGKVIESVTSKGFADFMDANIFEPLNMTRSSFRDYPHQAHDGYLDEELEKQRAIGYRWVDGEFIAYDTFFVPRGHYPASSASATATDMATFMLAHLNGGAIDGKRILAAQTVEKMHTRLRNNHAGIPGNAHGFWAGQIRGYHTLEHGGLVLGFLSNMVLVRELGLGVFVSTNGDSGRGLTDSLPRRLIEHFYPSESRAPQPDPAFSDQHKVYSGKYLTNRRGYEIADKMVMLGSDIAVDVDDEGYLIVGSSKGPQRWLPVGNHVFENVDNGTRMAFEVDDSGIATRLYDPYGHKVADRVSLFRSSQFFFWAAGFTLVLSIGCLFGFWRRRRQSLAQTQTEKIAARALGAASLIWLPFFASFAAFLSTVTVPEPEFLARYPTPLAWVVHLSATFAAISLVVSALCLAQVWRTGNWTVGRRIRHSAVVVVGLVFVWVLNDWNVLGLRYLGA